MAGFAPLFWGWFYDREGDPANRSLGGGDGRAKTHAGGTQSDNRVLELVHRNFAISLLIQSDHLDDLNDMGHHFKISNMSRSESWLKCQKMRNSAESPFFGVLVLFRSQTGAKCAPQEGYGVTVVLWNENE